MPLTGCPDCGNQVSDQARACPQCGRPTRSRPSLVVRTFTLLMVWCGLVGTWLGFGLLGLWQLSQLVILFAMGWLLYTLVWAVARLVFKAQPRRQPV